MSHMNPRQMASDHANCVAAHAIFATERRSIAVPQGALDLHHIQFRQSALRSTTSSLSPLLPHVGHVIGMSTKKQMGRTKTFRIITMMKNTETARNRTDKYPICDTMGVLWMSRDFDYAVSRGAATMTTFRPFPTTERSALDSIQKPKKAYFLLWKNQA